MLSQFLPRFNDCRKLEPTQSRSRGLQQTPSDKKVVARNVSFRVLFDFCLLHLGTCDFGLAMDCP